MAPLALARYTARQATPRDNLPPISSGKDTDGHVVLKATTPPPPEPS